MVWYDPLKRCLSDATNARTQWLSPVSSCISSMVWRFHTCEQLSGQEWKSYTTRSSKRLQNITTDWSVRFSQCACVHFIFFLLMRMRAGRTEQLHWKVDLSYKVNISFPPRPVWRQISEGHVQRYHLRFLVFQYHRKQSLLFKTSPRRVYNYLSPILKHCIFVCVHRVYWRLWSKFSQTDLQLVKWKLILLVSIPLFS